MTGFSSESSDFQFPEWQCEFEAAMCERDGNRLPERLKSARSAIFSRLRAKAVRPPGTLERIALNDAIHLLRVVRTEVDPEVVAAAER